MRAKPIAIATAAAISLVSLGLVLMAVANSDNTLNSSGEGVRTRIIEGDVDYALSADDLIRESSAIVVGIPIGKATFTVQTETGLLGDYLQSVRVLDVLYGDTPKTIQVVRTGLNEELVREGENVIHADIVGGPLPSKPVVLFLQPSARPDAYSIVGHTQGTLILQEDAEVRGADARSEALEHNGFEELRGLTITELRARVAAVKP